MKKFKAEVGFQRFFVNVFCCLLEIQHVRGKLYTHASETKSNYLGERVNHYDNETNDLKVWNGSFFSWWRLKNQEECFFILWEFARKSFDSPHHYLILLKMRFYLALVCVIVNGIRKCQHTDEVLKLRPIFEKKVGAKGQ